MRFLSESLQGFDFFFKKKIIYQNCKSLQINFQLGD